MARRSVGKLIKKRRQELKLTQQQLALASGVGQGHLSQIERNIKVPTLPTLRKLRDALAVDDATFVDWIEAASEPYRRPLKPTGGAAA